MTWAGSAHANIETLKIPNPFCNHIMVPEWKISNLFQDNFARKNRFFLDLSSLDRWCTVIHDADGYILVSVKRWRGSSSRGLINHWIHQNLLGLCSDAQNARTLKLKWRAKYRRQRNTWTADWGSECSGSSERDTLASVLLASCCCCHDCPTPVGTFSSHTALSALPTSKLAAAAAPPPPPPPPPSFSPLPAISSARFGVFYPIFATPTYSLLETERLLLLQCFSNPERNRKWQEREAQTGKKGREREPRERTSEQETLTLKFFIHFKVSNVISTLIRAALDEGPMK